MTNRTEEEMDAAYEAMERGELEELDHARKAVEHEQLAEAARSSDQSAFGRAVDAAYHQMMADMHRGRA